MTPGTSTVNPRWSSLESILAISLGFMAYTIWAYDDCYIRPYYFNTRIRTYNIIHFYRLYLGFQSRETGFEQTVWSIQNLFMSKLVSHGQNPSYINSPSLKCCALVEPRKLTARCYNYKLLICQTKIE